MIDVCAIARMFPDAHLLAAGLAAAVVTINRHSSRFAQEALSHADD
jgi:hypothetical protein